MAWYPDNRALFLASIIIFFDYVILYILFEIEILEKCPTEIPLSNILFYVIKVLYICNLFKKKMTHWKLPRCQVFFYDKIFGLTYKEYEGLIRSDTLIGRKELKNTGAEYFEEYEFSVSLKEIL